MKLSSTACFLGVCWAGLRYTLAGGMVMPIWYDTSRQFVRSVFSLEQGDPLAVADYRSTVFDTDNDIV